MKESWLDQKVSVGEVKKVSLDELVLDLLEPHIRYISPVKVWFAGGKIIFFDPATGVTINAKGKTYVRHVYGDVVYADVDCYKRYIAVGMDGAICFHDNLTGIRTEDAVIPVLNGSAFGSINVILKKIEETEKK
jgi:hypothetical protein